MSYHGPWSIGNLCILCIEVNEKLEEFIIIIITGSKQNNADDIWRSSVEHSLRVKGASCTDTMYIDMNVKSQYTYLSELFL